MKHKAPNAATRCKQLARSVGLRYVSDEMPGFTRRRRGSGFIYLDEEGKQVRDKDAVLRIKGLVIPPAWQDVWICPLENGHLQVTGFDARKRKQYLYHARWQDAANLDKFARLLDFGNLLPSIRRKVRGRLKGAELSRERVLSGIIALLDCTSIRVGNEEYVKANNSFGLTTLRNRHLSFERNRAVLNFRGKSGVHQLVVVEQQSCVRLLRQCHKLPGALVFQYLDEEKSRRAATAPEVNDFLQTLTDEGFTAKDFRTWAASALVAGRLYEQLSVATVTGRKKVARAIVKEASNLLGNTISTVRKYYIHPLLLESYERGKFPEIMRRFSPDKRQGVKSNEKLLATFLRRTSCR